MKRFIKCICILITLSMLLVIPAMAAELPDARSSSFFMSSSVYLYKTSSKTFEAWFDVTAVRTMDKIGASEIKIQRSTDNENWSTVKTYSMDDYSSMIRENTAGHESYVTYTGSSGYYYRAYIKLYAKDENGSANMNRYTSSIYIS